MTIRREKPHVVWLSFSLWLSKTNFLWQTVYFENEFKRFIGSWKIASWNLFLNILLYKLSSHIWCFPGTYSKTEGSVSLWWGWNWDTGSSSSLVAMGRIPHASPRWARADMQRVIDLEVAVARISAIAETRGLLCLSSLNPLYSQFKPKKGHFTALCFLWNTPNYLEWFTEQESCVIWSTKC